MTNQPDNDNPLMPENPTIVKFARDENGLAKNVEYKFTPEGRVDWKAMLRSGDLYVKKEFRDEVVKKYSKALCDLDLTTVEDRYLLVTLAGINRLANLRGMRALTYPQVIVTADKAVAVCEIEFIGNFESDGLPFICSSMASATPRSMDANFLPYMETFAENRAFVRCVKRALQIDILSDTEIGGDSAKKLKDEQVDESTPQSGGFEPYHKLMDVCNTQNPKITFETLKAAAVQHNQKLPADHKDRIFGDPAEWTAFNSIPPLAAYLLISLIQERAAQAAKPKSPAKK